MWSVDEGGFEDWDADFLDQLIQVEEFALSSTANNPIIPSSSSTFFPPPPPPLQPEPQHLVEVPVSYSPPRELSQRAAGLRSHAVHSPNALDDKCGPSSSALDPCLPRPDAAKELEICDLKRELGRVSKQLKDLEHECVELRKERERKEEQLKVVFSNKNEQYKGHRGSESTDLRTAGKDGGHTGRKSEDIAGELGGLHTVTSTSKATGEHGDKAHNSVGKRANDDLPAFDKLSKKLQVFWVPESDSKMGQNLVSELLLSCETDFQVLFQCIGMELSSKFSVDSLAGDNSSHVALKHPLQFFHGSEAIKVSNLYTTLTKVSNGIVKMEALFTPLLELCNLDNVAVVHRSLHILHMFLKRLLWLERKPERKTVMIGGLGSRNNVMDSHGSLSAEGEEFSLVNMDATSNESGAPAGSRLPGAEMLCKNRNMNKNTNLVPQVKWVSFFELMHQVAKTHSAESVRIETVSVMILILMRNNTYMEREQFGQALLFDSVVELIRKESGSAIQMHAVRLLFLILNCPTFFVAFCSGCKEAEAADAADENVRCVGGFQKFRTILHGLADCLTCCSNGIVELKLRRNTVLLLAFLASSGKAGFEILISNKLYTDSNFLTLILQVVVSEVEQEKKVPEPVEILEERALVLREVLILLNRLASHSLYSGTVLRVLTNSRDMASLTIDVMNTLSRRNNRSCQIDSKKRKMREAEVVELAQLVRMNRGLSSKHGKKEIIKNNCHMV